MLIGGGMSSSLTPLPASKLALSLLSVANPRENLLALNASPACEALASALLYISSLCLNAGQVSNSIFSFLAFCKHVILVKSKK